jgi:hypothetical protein
MILPKRWQRTRSSEDRPHGDVAVHRIPAAPPSRNARDSGRHDLRLESKPYRFIAVVGSAVTLFYLFAFACLAFCPGEMPRVYVGLLTIGLSVLFGGAFGGFVFSMVAGRQYVLKLPTRVQDLQSEKKQVEEYELGHLGHTIVGIAAGLVSVPLVFRLTNAQSPLHTVSWNGTTQQQIGQIYNIAEISLGLSTLSFVAGFLGLRLIASVAKRALQAVDKDLAEFAGKVTSQVTSEVTSQVTANIKDELTFSEVRALFDAGKFRESHALTVELEKSPEYRFRAVFNRARALSRLQQLGEAIALLGQALDMDGGDATLERKAYAYFNRACYRTLALADPSAEIDRIINDLSKSIELKSEFKYDLASEPDLKALHSLPQWKALLAELKVG